MVNCSRLLKTAACKNISSGTENAFLWISCNSSGVLQPAALEKSDEGCSSWASAPAPVPPAQQPGFFMIVQLCLVCDMRRRWRRRHVSQCKGAANWWKIARPWEGARRTDFRQSRDTRAHCSLAHNQQRERKFLRISSTHSAILNTRGVKKRQQEGASRGCRGRPRWLLHAHANRGAAAGHALQQPTRPSTTPFLNYMHTSQCEERRFNQFARWALFKCGLYFCMKAVLFDFSPPPRS